MSSAEVELVTAMKRRMSMRTAPPWPRSVIAVAGAESPAATWSGDSGWGYVGKAGLLVRAAHPRPMAVAKPNGIPADVRTRAVTDEER